MAQEEDLKSWGERDGIPAEDIQKLQDQGINTIGDLTRKVKELDLFKTVRPGDSLTNPQLRIAVNQLKDLDLGVSDGATATDSNRRRVQESEGFQARDNSGFRPGSHSATGHDHQSSYKQAPTTDIDIHLETFRLILLGKTGCGKSTTGNTILGEKRFETGTSFTSVTYDCMRVVGQRGTLQLEVMDCPGLFDTKLDQEEICTIVVKAVAGMNPGPHALLYVIKLGRYTHEEHGVYKRLKVLFDDHLTNHMILVFTGGDDLGGLMGSEASAMVAQMIQNKGPKELQEVFMECGQRVVIFDNKTEEKESQVKYFFQQIRKLNERNGKNPYECPKYASISQALDEEVARRVENVEKDDAQRQKFVQQLEKEKKNAEDKVQETSQEIRRKEEEWQQKEMEEAKKREEMEREMNEQKRIAEEQQDNLKRIEKEREEAERRMKEREQEMKERERQRMEKEAEVRREEQARMEQMQRDIQNAEEEAKRLLEEKAEQQRRADQLAQKQREQERERERERIEQERMKLELKAEQKRQEEARIKMEKERKEEEIILNELRKKQQEEKNKIALAEREAERQRERAELQRQQRKAEELRERQRRQEREAEERRCQLEQVERERLKQGVVDGQEPGFAKSVKNVVAATAKGVTNFAKSFFY